MKGSDIMPNEPQAAAEVVNPNLQLNASGQAPIHVAAENGDISSIIEIIRECPEALDLPESSGNTPLIVATECNQPYVVRGLLLLGANINAQGRNGDTALHLAIEHRRDLIMVALLDYDVDLSIENDDGQTARDLYVEEDIVGDLLPSAAEATYESAAEAIYESVGESEEGEDEGTVSIASTSSVESSVREDSSIAGPVAPIDDDALSIASSAPSICSAADPDDLEGFARDYAEYLVGVLPQHFDLYLSDDMGTDSDASSVLSIE